MNSLFDSSPIVVPVVQVGTILKVNRHFENVYHKIVAIDKDSYTLLECDAVGGAVRCPQKAVLSASHFSENFACGWWSVVSEPTKKVSLFPSQKRSLMKAMQKIRALQTEPKKLR